MTSSIPTNTPAVPFKRPPPRVVEVRRVTRLTPRMIRITFGGEQMAGFESKGPAEHIRVYMPDSETGELPLPVMGPEGNAFPGDRRRPDSRVYTPRRWGSETRELDIDIAFHDEGPGPAWAAGVKEGDIAVISGRPGGTYFPNLDADWYLIGGDEAALPAIGTLIEALPSSMHAHVLAEVQDADEELELESAATLQMGWLHRRAGETPGRALSAAIREAKLPKGRGCVWVSCEAAIMREIRRHFIEERGLDRSMLRTQGYWKAGEPNHPDHDMGEDV